MSGDIQLVARVSVPMQTMSVFPHVLSLVVTAPREGTKIVSCIDAITDKLTSDRLACRLSLPSRVVGIHPANWVGRGVSTTEMQALGPDVAAMGWSWAEDHVAVRIEADTLGHFVHFNANVANESDGDIGYGPSGIVSLHGIVSGIGTRCVISGTVSQHGVLCSDHRKHGRGILGRLSDAGFNKVLGGPLPSWIVLNTEVATFYPDKTHLIQSRAQRLEGELKVFIRIACVVKNFSKTQDGEVTVDWGVTVVVSAYSTAPPIAGQAPPGQRTTAHRRIIGKNRPIVAPYPVAHRGARTKIIGKSRPIVAPYPVAHRGARTKVIGKSRPIVATYPLPHRGARTTIIGKQSETARQSWSRQLGGWSDPPGPFIDLDSSPEVERGNPSMKEEEVDDEADLLRADEDNRLQTELNRLQEAADWLRSDEDVEE
jgi:hypothetical protein